MFRRPKFWTPIDTLLTGFGSATSAAEVARGVDLTGARCAGNRRFVRSWAGDSPRKLGMSGAIVHVTAPDPLDARAALNGIDGIAVWPLDLADQASVEAATRAFLEHQPRSIFWFSMRGYGPAALPATNVAGRAIFRSITLDTMSSPRCCGQHCSPPGNPEWSSCRPGAVRCPMSISRISISRVVPMISGWLGQSKTANTLFAVSLDRRGRGYGVRAFSVHPGMIVTPGIRHLSRSEFDAVGVSKRTGRL